MNDRISFRCPCCAAGLSGSTWLAGRSGPCPRCGCQVTVPRRARADQPPVFATGGPEVLPGEAPQRRGARAKMG